MTTTETTTHFTILLVKVLVRSDSTRVIIYSRKVKQNKKLFFIVKIKNKSTEKNKAHTKCRGRNATTVLYIRTENKSAFRIENEFVNVCVCVCVCVHAFVCMFLT